MGFFKQLFQDLFERGELSEGPEYDGPDNPVSSVPQELLDAETRVPHANFVKSCRAFFEKRGFLSVAQRRALTYAGTPNRRYRQFSDYDGEFGDNPFDPDRD